MYGNARVYGNAEVYGNARVYGDAHYLTISSIGSRKATTTFFRAVGGVLKVRCGCFYGTIEAFAEKVRETHGDNRHAKAYAVAIELAKTVVDTTVDGDPGETEV